jgi:DNA-binding transcriptional LysR family regulator
MITSDILLFVRVAETSSFKEAARQLNISASQASKRIASIEDEHGARLFYRTPRNISLTSAGETLLEYYRRIHQMIEESRAAIGQLASRAAGCDSASPPVSARSCCRSFTPTLRNGIRRS